MFSVIVIVAIVLKPLRSEKCFLKIQYLKVGYRTENVLQLIFYNISIHN